MEYFSTPLLILFFSGISSWISPHRVLAKQTTVSIRHIVLVSPTPTVTPTPLDNKASNGATLDSLSISNSGQTPTPTPTPTPQLSDIDSSLLQEVNAYRNSQGLGPVSSETSVCIFATTRAQEITANFSHDGFTTRITNKTLPYPSYSLVVENIAMNPNYQDVVSAWKSSPGHAENMRADTPYGCIGHSGNYYVYEGWRP